MIQYLKDRYAEYKWNKIERQRREDYRDYEIGFRDHPKAHDENFNRYEAIAHVTRELTRYGVLEHGKILSVSKDGKRMYFNAKKKHYKFVHKLSMRVI